MLRAASVLALLVSVSACDRSAGPTSAPELAADDSSLIDSDEFMGPQAADVAPTPVAPAVPRPDSVLYRSEVNRATAGGKAGYLLSQLQPEAHRPRGRWEGWVITTVFPRDPTLCTPGCDLFPGDIILTINGSPLERPEHLSALMEALPTLEKLSVRLVREGRLHEREFAILDG